VDLGLIWLYAQDFAPEPNTYDVIWIQWVIGHLHDVDFIKFFKRCCAGLREGGELLFFSSRHYIEVTVILCVWLNLSGGVVVLKDNCSESWTFIVDKDDSSVNRSGVYMHALFLLAGIDVILEVRQTGFPEELYPVWMFALVPSKTHPNEILQNISS
jgi:protein N-terminal methyltransferase